MQQRAPMDRRPFFLGLVLLASCGGSGGSGGGASTAAPVTSTSSSGVVPTPPPTGAGAPLLSAARWRDLDQSRSVTAGDEVVLTFDRAVRLDAPDVGRDLQL